MSKSSSNLNEIVYSGRPKNEEPHVKKSVKKKTERTEYMVRVDLVRYFKSPVKVEIRSERYNLRS